SHQSGGASPMSTVRESTLAEVEQAAILAESSLESFTAAPPAQVAALLEAIASEIEALGDQLIELASRETSLPAARLTGERARTTGQLRLFASLVRDGSWKAPRMDAALPDRQPARRPDLRRMLVPIGPVAVWAA